MSIATPILPPPTPTLPHAYLSPDDALWPISVEHYHKMLDVGILDEDSPIELLEGYLVTKMSKHPPHTIVVYKSGRWLDQKLPPNYYALRQDPVTLATSEPEADVSVIRGQPDDFVKNHPGAGDVALIVEVSDSTLRRDRGWKKRIYAQANIPQYWIINLVDRQIETYRDPDPATGDYGESKVFGTNDDLAVAIDGVAIGTLRLQELLPNE